MLSSPSDWPAEAKRLQQKQQKQAQILVQKVRCPELCTCDVLLVICCSTHFMPHLLLPAYTQYYVAQKTCPA